MTIYRCILPEWATIENPDWRRSIEGTFTDEEVKDLNSLGYNIYFFPNSPSTYDGSHYVNGSDIDTFSMVFIDMDLKEKKYGSKSEFIQKLNEFPLPPMVVVDSGNGVHAYWEIKDLDAKSYLRFQRRLCRALNTDPAVSKLDQLMRVPNTINTKNKNELKSCVVIGSVENVSPYSAEELDKVLPPITAEDESYCQTHYDNTHSIRDTSSISTELPAKFHQLMKNNDEVKDIWTGNVEDRSAADYRLGHILYGAGFTKEEATSVLSNTQKASTRAPTHRYNYANNIVSKVWEHEESTPIVKINPGDSKFTRLSSTVQEILNKYGANIQGIRFPCWNYLDSTEAGFRLGQVLGLVAGSGAGKTAIALNMFAGFVENNPDYDHMFVSLEQPDNEIAKRWSKVCGDNKKLHDKVHILGNYDVDGSFRHLSLHDIQKYIAEFEAESHRKIGCVVIDHIGALKKKGKQGENQDLMDICHKMKAFAIQSNVFLVMQSQSSRDKAGIGDLELDKDAAYGTVFFESYCDYLITTWQPLKRCYAESGCPTVTAFKFCKIRHKNTKVDKIQEDVCYTLYFEPETEKLRYMTQHEMTSFEFFNNKAINKRRQCKKTDVMKYNSRVDREEQKNGTADSNSNQS